MIGASATGAAGLPDGAAAGAALAVAGLAGGGAATPAAAKIAGWPAAGLAELGAACVAVGAAATPSDAKMAGRPDAAAGDDAGAGAEGLVGIAGEIGAAGRAMGTIGTIGAGGDAWGAAGAGAAGPTDDANSVVGMDAAGMPGVGSMAAPTSAMFCANSSLGAGGTGMASGNPLSDGMVSPSPPNAKDGVGIGGADGTDAPPCPTWSVNSNCIPLRLKHPTAL